MLALLLAAMPPLSPADVGLETPGTARAVAPKLVRRGQQVTLAVRSGTLTITAQGRALSDGKEGDPVRVVTPSSRTIEGIVEASGAVRIGSLN